MWRNRSQGAESKIQCSIKFVLRDLPPKIPPMTNSFKSHFFVLPHFQNQHPSATTIFQGLFLFYRFSQLHEPHHDFTKRRTYRACQRVDKSRAHAGSYFPDGQNEPRGHSFEAGVMRQRQMGLCHADGEIIETLVAANRHRSLYGHTMKYGKRPTDLLGIVMVTGENGKSTAGNKRETKSHILRAYF